MKMELDNKRVADLKGGAEAEVFASVWGSAPFAVAPAKKAESEPEVVFASSWDPPVLAAAVVASEPETPPWEAEREAAPDAIELDALWDSFDTEIDHWLREGLCPHCQETLPNLLGTSRGSCDFWGSGFVTPNHMAVLELAQD